MKNNKNREDLLKHVLHKNDIFYTNTNPKTYNKLKHSMREFANKCIEFEAYNKTLNIIKHDIDCHDDVVEVGECVYNPILNRFEINNIVFNEYELILGFLNIVKNDDEVCEYFRSHLLRNDYHTDDDQNKKYYDYLSVNFDWVNKTTLNLTVTLV